MQILIIGDFHGKFSVKLKKLAKSKEIDLIIALGDYANADKIRKIIFKNWTNKSWFEVVGMKKAKEMERESFNSGLKILKELNSLKKPVYLIWGNSDFYKDYRFSESPIFMPGFYNDKIMKMKNLVLFDKKKKSLKDFDLMGHGGYLALTDFIKYPSEDKERHKETLKLYNEDKKRLKKLFLKNKLSKNFIFAIHYPPYGVFDKILHKKSPMYKKSGGWLPYTEIIKKYEPKLVLCGHMHEYQGKKMLGKSFVVNPGIAQEGKAAIIDYPSLKVRFIR